MQLKSGARRWRCLCKVVELFLQQKYSQLTTYLLVHCQALDDCFTGPGHVLVHSSKSIGLTLHPYLCRCMYVPQPGQAKFLLYPNYEGHHLITFIRLAGVASPPTPQSSSTYNRPPTHPLAQVASAPPTYIALLRRRHDEAKVNVPAQGDQAAKQHAALNGYQRERQ